MLPYHALLVHIVIALNYLPPVNASSAILVITVQEEARPPLLNVRLAMRVLKGLSQPHQAESTIRLTSLARMAPVLKAICVPRVHLFLPHVLLEATSRVKDSLFVWTVPRASTATQLGYGTQLHSPPVRMAFTASKQIKCPSLMEASLPMEARARQDIIARTGSASTAQLEATNPALVPASARHATQATTAPRNHSPPLSVLTLSTALLAQAQALAVPMEPGTLKLI